ncbi:Pyrrolidone-carboxylate peptidase [Pseudomonas sp. R2-37-08W]|nr:Pyrrolidone-carboxylate peptidase [Pseudomonas sp. R2-37-08W]
MNTLLLTGFEPFDHDDVNPSWEAVRQLEGMQLSDDVRIVARQLPCAFATAADTLMALIDELHPVMVIATGLGPGRSDISIERVAINVNDARIPDNLGAQPIDTAVVEGGRPLTSRHCRSSVWSGRCGKRVLLPRFRRRRARSCVIRCFIDCSMRWRVPQCAVGLSMCRACLGPLSRQWRCRC